MGSMLEEGSRPAADAEMDTDRVHPDAVSDGERDFEKQKSKPEYQDAFGDEEYAEVKYKTLSWWQCGFLMVAETVSLGILSLPAVVAALGLVPAVILLVALGLMSTYTGYTIGQFKWRHPFIHSMGDAGEIIMGRFGRELFGTGQLLLVVFIMASHILTFTVAMNSITDHGTCSIVFGVVGLVISFVLCLPRTLAKVSFLSVASFISVFSAVLVVMIAVGVQRPWHGSVNATVDTSLYKAFLAVCNIVFSFSGHVAFFGFMAELKDPHDYPKSLFLLQGIDTCLYIVAAVVIYCYAGDDVTSPALGSASTIVKKVAYGIALPTIIIGGVVNGHVACKYIYVRMWRHSDRMHKRDLVATGSWVLIGLATWIVAWIIAEAIPVFNNLLSLVASLFASWFTYGFSALFWLHLNKGRFFSTPMKTALTILNIFIMGIACCICGLGLYVSGKALHDDPGSAMPAGLTALDGGATLCVCPSVVGCIWCLTGSSDLRRSTCVRTSVSISCRLYRLLATGRQLPHRRGNFVLQREVLVAMPTGTPGCLAERSLAIALLAATRDAQFIGYSVLQSALVMWSRKRQGVGFGEWDCHGRIEGEGSCAELLDVGWKVNEG
ncbi:hypothetical protein CNMCM6936_004287 [Aspergillus lentulus]|uniref:Amino acid transporter transmembrane domain-containing protein n=1 Tax=Aspergillus lentulus TaxID=293939 RepID=A0AAN5YEF8_ASPLE|nr:hypothetical protein CNMCM6936_004287 [Aspergillus lentulus]KAF4170868.1 hypothetical protein CNMCM8060_004102 [Aspergillus lentulus]KAF4191087.1 hypothetical protein CNMCM8694_002384 [Aspergillus lentulus]KAF4200131.1 hypothetical protein CNMCM8927_003954 [Aspergillus lentulus]